MALVYGKLSNCIHLCIDMQRLFAEPTDWHVPWMSRVLPLVQEIVARHAAQTIFTRFIPAQSSGQGRGAWKRFYERWSHMTVDEIGDEILGLIPELAAFVPPASIMDKSVYGPWIGTDLHRQLQSWRTDTLVISGGETDVCVLAAVSGAVDLGYRVILASDALCSASDESHDAQLKVYRTRYSLQIETATTKEILENWQ
jgi:nicotinamidase-related amidase